MSIRVIESLATTEPLADVFSDRSILAAMLAFEIALARVEARFDVIPREAADAITQAADPDLFDAAELARETLRAGTSAIPFVKALTERVRSVNPDAARFVHWGATSQDVVDTAFVLLLKQALPLLEADHLRIDVALGKISKQHQD